jgi:hypothetical protein
MLQGTSKFVFCFGPTDAILVKPGQVSGRTTYNLLRSARSSADQMVYHAISNSRWSSKIANGCIDRQTRSQTLVCIPSPLSALLTCLARPEQDLRGQVWVTVQRQQQQQQEVLAELYGPITCRMM